MAGYVFDDDPAPPLLTQAFDMERYGANILDIHPGAFRGMRAASNAYHALSGYRNAAGKTVEWTQRNPDAWEFVAQVLAARREAAKE